MMEASGSDPVDSAEEQAFAAETVGMRGAVLEVAVAAWFMGITGYYYYSKGFFALVRQLVEEGPW